MWSYSLISGKLCRDPVMINSYLCKRIHAMSDTTCFCCMVSFSCPKEVRILQLSVFLQLQQAKEWSEGSSWRGPCVLSHPGRGSLSALPAFVNTFPTVTPSSPVGHRWANLVLSKMKVYMLQRVVRKSLLMHTYNTGFGEMR